MTFSKRNQYSLKIERRERAKRQIVKKWIFIDISLFSTLEAFDMSHLLNQCVTERSWQCLQTEVEREIFENRKEKEINEIEIENWRERFSRTCVDSNVSNLSNLKANEIVALKYNVMRICMKLHLHFELLSRLHLSKIFEESERIWCRCKSNEFDFSTNMRNKSFTMR